MENLYLPHPLCPPLLQRRGGGDYIKRGFAPLKLLLVISFEEA